MANGPWINLSSQWEMTILPFFSKSNRFWSQILFNFFSIFACIYIYLTVPKYQRPLNQSFENPLLMILLFLHTKYLPFFNIRYKKFTNNNKITCQSISLLIPGKAYFMLDKCCFTVLICCCPFSKWKGKCLNTDKGAFVMVLESKGFEIVYFHFASFFTCVCVLIISWYIKLYAGNIVFFFIVSHSSRWLLHPGIQLKTFQSKFLDFIFQLYTLWSWMRFFHYIVDVYRFCN